MIIDGPIPLEALVAAAAPPDCGGTAIFVGRVRDHNEGRPVLRLYYECYRSMAEKVIRRIEMNIADETGARSLKIVHRVGWLEVGEAAVAVVAHAGHRAEAFDACRSAIDRVKSEAPIWKKEVYADESQAWVVCQHQHHTKGGDTAHAEQRSADRVF